MMNNKSGVMGALGRLKSGFDSAMSSKMSYTKADPTRPMPYKNLQMEALTKGMNRPVQIEVQKSPVRPQMRQFGDRGYVPSNGVKVGP